MAVPGPPRRAGGGRPARRGGSSPGARPSRARVARIRDRLREMYGRPLAPPHGDGLSELVLTVLSQSTSDRNRDVAFLRLRRRMPAWQDVRDAPPEAVLDAIRPGGLAPTKAA